MKCLTDIKDNEVSLFLLTWQKFQDTLLVELGDDTTYDLKTIHSAHTFTWTHTVFMFNEHLNKYVEDSVTQLWSGCAFSSFDGEKNKTKHQYIES